MSEGITVENINELKELLGISKHQQLIRDAQMELNKSIDARLLAILSRAGVREFEFNDCRIYKENTPAGFIYSVEYRGKRVGQIIVTISDNTINIKHEYS